MGDACRAVALIFFGCIFIDVGLGLLSLGLWLLPLPSGVSYLDISTNRYSNASGFSTRYYASARCCAFLGPRRITASRCRRGCKSFSPTVSAANSTGTAGRNHDVSTVMGFAAIASVVGTLGLVVGAYNVVKERFRKQNRQSHGPDRIRVVLLSTLSHAVDKKPPLIFRPAEALGRARPSQ